MEKSEYDSYEIYCRKLGHHLFFSYCRMESMDRTCSRIHECWSHKIPIADIFPEHVLAADGNTIPCARSAKILNILDIVEKVRSRNNN